jgi:hypothetical protein
MENSLKFRNIGIGLQHPILELEEEEKEKERGVNQIIQYTDFATGCSLQQINIHKHAEPKQSRHPLEHSAHIPHYVNKLKWLRKICAAVNNLKNEKLYVGQLFWKCKYSEGRD